MALCGHVRAALIPVQDALSALLAETALETGRDTLQEFSGALGW
jgi:hypothetical protein